MRTKCFLALQFIAFWPVWRWYVLRMLDGSDEPWGLFALLSAVVVVLVKGKRLELSSSVVLSCSLITALYALSFAYAPALVRALLAVFAFGISLSWYAFQTRFHFALVALLVLSLPLIASLQFFAGYPVRLMTAHLAALFVQVSGVAVSVEGVNLLWLGELISVDAPCSGIRMLWSGLFLNFTLATWNGLSALKSILSYYFATLLIFLGNVLRATLLFFGESGIVAYPEWGHEAIGLLVFATIAAGIMFVQGRLEAASN